MATKPSPVARRSDKSGGDSKDGKGSIVELIVIVIVALGLALGIQQFLGQYITDWNAVLSALSTAIIPVLILYVVFSRQLIRGLTSGAVK